MLFNYLIDILPVCLAFSTPMMPVGGLPQSPTASADAEKQRQAASDAATKAATQGGRASTIHAGNDIAYAKQRRMTAGTDLMGAGSSRDMGL
jgi:hypothetical protein